MASQTKRKRIDSVDSQNTTDVAQQDAAPLRSTTNRDKLPVPVNSRDELRNLNPYIYVYDCHQFEEYDFPHNKIFGSLHERMSVNLESNFIPFEFRKYVEASRYKHIIKESDFEQASDRYKTLPEATFPRAWNILKAIVRDSRIGVACVEGPDHWRSVFEDLMEVAVGLYGDNTSVVGDTTSLDIKPAYLPTLLNGASVASRADFVLAVPVTSTVPEGTGEPHEIDLSHLEGDSQDHIFFSGVKITTRKDDLNKAEADLCMWMSASLRNKRASAERLNTEVKPKKCVEPMIVVSGHEHHLYYCSLPWNDTWKTGPTCVAESELLGSMMTTNLRGVFQLLRFYGNLMQHGNDTSENGFRGYFVDKILAKLARQTERKTDA